MYFPNGNKIAITRDVDIDEDKQSQINVTPTSESSSDTEEVQFEDPFKPFYSESDVDQEPYSIISHYGDDASETNDAIHVESNPNILEDYMREELTHYPIVRCSARVVIAPNRLRHDTALFLQETMMKTDDSASHLSYKEAVTGIDSEEWKQAMDEEMQEFEKMKIWTPVTCPKMLDA